MIISYKIKPESDCLNNSASEAGGGSEAMVRQRRLANCFRFSAQRPETNVTKFSYNIYVANFQCFPNK